MAYIGKTPVIGNFVKLDAISVVNGQAAYTMNNGGSAFTNYDNVNQFLVSLNGILQAPTDSFTVSGSTLTFASNLATGDVIDFVIVLGNTLDIGTPSDNTVSLAKLTATGTKDATTFLRGDNTFASAGGNNTPAFRATLGSSQSIPNNTQTKVQFDTEDFDTDSCYDNATNYRFTPTSSGKYFVGLAVRFNTGSVSITSNFIFKNGSQFYAGEYSNISNNNWFNGTIVTLNGSSDYIEAYCYQNSGGSVNIIAGQFFAYKLIGV